MPRASCDLEYDGSAPSRARRFVRETVGAWRLDRVGVEAELIATELVTNAVLHGAPPVLFELSYVDETLRIGVADASNAGPIAGLASTDAMTGRGLQLVGSLSARWGVAAGAGGGKLVWAEVGLTDEADDEPPDDDGALVPAGELAVGVAPADLDAVHDDGEPTSEDGEPTYEIVLGDVPTDLLVAAKAHVDNVVRELTLASAAGSDAGHDAGRHAGLLGGQLGELLRDVVIGFSHARQSIKRQAIEAATRGDERTRLTLVVTAAAADAGERYLAALDEVDEFARAARLLTVESPPQHRAFRHWYVQSLVDQVRARARGESPSEPPTFERFLLDEVSASALARRASERTARLQLGDGFCSLDAGWCVTYVNSAAERLLGVDRTLLIGRRLWGDVPSKVAVPDEALYREALAAGRPIEFERHTDGRVEHFEVRVQPIPDGVGVYFTDVSESRRFEHERAELEAESRRARAGAEAARARFSFIAEVSADITTTLDPGEVCRRLATHAVQSLADWVSIYVIEADQCRRIATAHRDPAMSKAVAALVGAYPVELSSSAMVARAARTQHPIVEQHMDDRLIEQAYPDPTGRALVEGIGVASAAAFPMIVSGEVVGVMAFIRSEQGNGFSVDELELAETLATRAALAVQNAQLFARQTTVAQVLQQAVLPEALPVIDGVDLSARYEPALGGAGVAATSTTFSGCRRD